MALAITVRLTLATEISSYPFSLPLPGCRFTMSIILALAIVMARDYNIFGNGNGKGNDIGNGNSHSNGNCSVIGINNDCWPSLLASYYIISLALAMKMKIATTIGIGNDCCLSAAFWQWQ